MIMNADRFGALVKADAARWERIVKEAGVTLD
jgi:tripartite-type tricarboxylate transporter receptor subunit TctC